MGDATALLLLIVSALGWLLSLAANIVGLLTAKFEPGTPAHKLGNTLRRRGWGANPWLIATGAGSLVTSLGIAGLAVYLLQSDRSICANAVCDKFDGRSTILAATSPSDRYRIGVSNGWLVILSPDRSDDRDPFAELQTDIPNSSITVRARLPDARGDQYINLGCRGRAGEANAPADSDPVRDSEYQLAIYPVVGKYEVVRLIEGAHVVLRERAFIPGFKRGAT